MMSLRSGDEDAGPFALMLSHGAALGVTGFELAETADIVIHRFDRIDRFAWADALKRLDRAAGAGARVLILDCAAEGFACDPNVFDPLLEAVEGMKSFARAIMLTHDRQTIRHFAALNHPRFGAAYMHYFYATLVRSAQTNIGDDAARAHYKRVRAPEAGPPPRRFSCLMNRARAHRMVIYGWLKQNGLLEQGLVSLHGDVFLTDPDRFAAALQEAYSRFPSFKTEIEAFAASAEQLPFTNFPASGKENFVVSFNITPYREAPLSLVVESEMSSGEIDRFTEKTLKSLVAGHRLLIAGNPGTLAALRALGFESFAACFDESYDSVTDPDQRLRRVLSELARYLAMPETEYRDFLAETWAVCAHNIDAFVAIGRAQVQSWHADLATMLRG